MPYNRGEEDEGKRQAKAEASRRYREKLRSDRVALDRIMRIAQKTKDRLSDEILTTAEHKLSLFEEMLRLILSKTNDAYEGSTESTEFEDDSEEESHDPLSMSPRAGPVANMHQPQVINHHGISTWPATQDDGGQYSMGVWNANLRGRTDPAMWMRGESQTGPTADGYMQTVPSMAMNMEIQTVAEGDAKISRPAAWTTDLGVQTDGREVTNQQTQTPVAMPCAWAQGQVRL